MLSVIIVEYVLFLHFATASKPQSSPTYPGEVALEHFVGYVSDPQGRGTVSLVISCLLTLVLCVWSALHLNIPGPRNTTRRWLWLNIRWIVAGIYCPELVVFTAWRQWSSARLLQNYIDNVRATEQNENLTQPGTRRPRWTMAHSFFACSGGFAFELDTLRDALPTPADGESQRPQRLTITARGMMFLAQSGQLPYVEKEEIEDKSKANALAKATVIIQAAWMLIQVVGRLQANLPVTLLEINTIAHVMCTFAMYLFWWNKPLLPNEPIVLRREELAPLAAVMYSSSEMSGDVGRENIQSQTIVKTLFAHFRLFSTTPEMETICLRPRPDSDHIERQSTLIQPTSRSDSTDSSEPTDRPSDHACAFQIPFVIRRAPKSCVQQIEACREKEKGTAFFERRPRVICNKRASEKPSPEELARWEMMEHGFEKDCCVLSGRILMTHEADGSQCIHLRTEQLVATHVQNWPSNDLLRNVDGLVVGMVLWLANFCYGGIHATAWNDHFPSTVEKWLWRLSASYIGFCGGLWVLLNFTVARSAKLNAFWERWMDGQKGPLRTFFLSVTVFVCGLSLILARMYVVVEAFVSIRELPVEAYHTPQWSDILPHL